MVRAHARFVIQQLLRQIDLVLAGELGPHRVATVFCLPLRHVLEILCRVPLPVRIRGAVAVQTVAYLANADPGLPGRRVTGRVAGGHDPEQIYDAYRNNGAPSSYTTHRFFLVIGKVNTSGNA